MIISAPRNTYFWCPMALNREDVRRISFLARIRIDDAELDSLSVELNNIIGWIEQLSEVDTDGITPMTSVADMKMTERTDSVVDGDVLDKVLTNAPDRVGDFYAVPKVVE